MTQDNVKQICIGIDLGDRHSHLCVLDAVSKEVLEESRIPTTRKAFQQRFGAMVPAQIAIEVGGHSPWISRLLEAAGHAVIVANSHKLRLIYANDSKSDRVDAQYLARLAAADPRLLHPLKHRKVQDQAARAMLLARDQLVACRTKLINSARGMAKAFGSRLPKTSTSSFHMKMGDHLPEELRGALQGLLAGLAALQPLIRAYDRKIEALSQAAYPETKLLRQIKGVGPITALNYVATISDPQRFQQSRTLGSYLGLRPRKHSSGKGDPELGITKAGDPMLRRNLVQSAQYILGPFGPDTDLRRFGLKLAARGGKNAKKKAIVAVARKLAVLLHRLLITGQEYEPLRREKDTGAVRAPA